MDLVVDRSIRAFKQIATDVGKPMKTVKRGPSLHSLFPWIFFYGECLDGSCGCGIIIHVSDQHFFSINLAAGRVSNTRAELIAFWGLLVVAKDKNINQIQVIDDSQVIINWF